MVSDEDFPSNTALPAQLPIGFAASVGVTNLFFGIRMVEKERPACHTNLAFRSFENRPTLIPGLVGATQHDGKVEVVVAQNPYSDTSPVALEIF